MTLWTAQEHAEMVRLTNEGLLSAEIAAIIGKTPVAIRNRAYRSGISLKAAGQFKRVAAGRRFAPGVTELGLVAVRTPEVQAKRIAAIRATAKARLIASGIPADRIAEYRAIKWTGVAAPEARRIVIEAVALDTAKAVKVAAAFKVERDRAEAIDAFLTRHDRQLAAVQAGTATVVERVFMPSRPETFVPSQSSMA
jgi:hypothetical protein